MRGLVGMVKAPFRTDLTDLTFRFKVNNSNPGLILWMARISQDLSRQELAAKIGVSEGAIRLWELGERSANEEVVEKLAIALNQDVELLKETEFPRFRITETNPHRRLKRLLWMARVSQGLSREELATKVNVCRETIRLWEQSKRPIDAVMLRQLAIALNQDMELFWS